MVLEILCVEPINPQYSGVLETCVALRYWFFEVLGSESVNNAFVLNILIRVQVNVKEISFGSVFIWYNFTKTNPF